MKEPIHFAIAAGTSLLLLVATISCSRTGAPDRPYIIYIMTDDHAAHALGAYGGRLAGLDPTPRLDQLAQEGMLFESSYVSNSICTPSRATMISGQYSQTNGVLDLWGDLDPARQYLPMEMRRLGYETAIVGKWHLHIEPTAFDHYCVLPGQGKYFDPQFREKGQGTWPENLSQYKGHSSDVITDRVISWLEGRQDKEKPFFLMYHFKAPHDMFEYDPEYEHYLEDAFIPEPANLYHQPDWGSEATRGRNDSLLHVIGSSISERHHNRNYVDLFKVDPSLQGDSATSMAYQIYLKKYLRCVKGVDDNLDRFFAYLKEKGLWDNTVIIYTSDQGMMLGEHDFEDKRWMYEESTRIPLIVKVPGLTRKGSRSELLVNNADFAPTILELAGGDVPSYMQGRSLVPILSGKEPGDWRTASYYRYWMHMVHHDIPAHFGIRTQRYKLIFFYARYFNLDKEGSLTMYWNDEDHSNKVLPTPVAWELYDLEKDPHEVHNVYRDTAYAEVVRELKAELAQQRAALNEEDGDYPHLQEIIDTHWND